MKIKVKSDWSRLVVWLLRQTGYWLSAGQRSNSKDLHAWQAAVWKCVSLQLWSISDWSHAACWPKIRDKLQPCQGLLLRFRPTSSNKGAGLVTPQTRHNMVTGHNSTALKTRRRSHILISNLMHSCTFQGDGPVAGFESVKLQKWGLEGNRSAVCVWSGIWTVKKQRLYFHAFQVYAQAQTYW